MRATALQATALAIASPDTGRAPSPDTGRAPSPDTGRVPSPDTGRAPSPDTCPGAKTLTNPLVKKSCL